MLKHRIITAAILIPVVVAVIFLPDPVWFQTVFAGIIVIAAREWSALCKSNILFQCLYSLMVAAILIALVWIDNAYIFNLILLAGVLFWGASVIIVVLYQSQHNLLPGSFIVNPVVGLFLLIPFWSSLMVLKLSANSGSILIMYLMLLVWSADTAAYFAGKKMGKRKLAFRVSPGKTWEGTIAGFSAAVIITVCYVVVSNPGIAEGVIFVGLSIVTVSLSVFGDLLESLVKREVKIKDSGTILPGHGGVLDRIDSLTAASPVFTYGLVSFGLLK